MSDSELLTIKEAAIYLKVHWQTVRNYISQNKLPAIKVGRIIRVPISELKQFQQQSTSKPAETAEIELRFKLKNPQETENKLRALGAVLSNHSHVIDHYFTPRFVNSIADNNRFYNSANGYGARIREMDNDYSGKVNLTLEIKKLAGPTYQDHSNCLEAEIEVTDLEATEQLLTLMDQKKFITIDKERLVYRIGNIKFCFDTIKNYGAALEIEKKGSEDVETVKYELWSWAKKLGLSKADMPEFSMTHEVMQKWAKF